MLYLKYNNNKINAIDHNLPKVFSKTFLKKITCQANLRVYFVTAASQLKTIRSLTTQVKPPSIG